MQFSESWLRSLCNPSLSSEELCHVLTMAGLEVEERRPASADFSNVVVAEVLSVGKAPRRRQAQALLRQRWRSHSAADRLWRTECRRRHEGSLRTGRCQAAGHRNQTVPKCAASRASACFARRANSVCRTITAVCCRLAADATVGEDIRRHLDLDDHLITLKLTPNRADCLSLLGIARELSALTGAPLCWRPRSSR
jgi:phenylalanyl-tRNA synthetase beta chain